MSEIKLKHDAIVFVREGTPEWDYMWAQLGPDPVELHPDTGEAWQYMGTPLFHGGRWLHQFRHRQRPPNGEREYRNIIVSKNFTLKDTDSKIVWCKE